MRTFVGAAGVAAGWVTTTLCPATVSVVVRTEAVVLSVAAIVTVPLPVPLPPLVMVSQDSDSDAVHAQVLVVVTVTLALPPLAASEGGFAAETVKLHAAASCATVTDCPATVSVALRGLVVVFAVAV